MVEGWFLPPGIDLIHVFVYVYVSAAAARSLYPYKIIYKLLSSRSCGGVGFLDLDINWRLQSKHQNPLSLSHILIRINIWHQPSLDDFLHFEKSEDVACGVTDHLILILECHTSSNTSYVIYFSDRFSECVRCATHSYHKICNPTPVTRHTKVQLKNRLRPGVQSAKAYLSAFIYKYDTYTYYYLPCIDLKNLSWGTNDPPNDATKCHNKSWLLTILMSPKKK